MSSSPPLVVADRYRLVAPLGQGGMGRVWRATDVVLHRDVAIKELVPPPGLTPGERQEMRERSLREARAIARLNNINVVRVFDVLRTDADPWIVMEYVPSRSLQDTLAADGPFTPIRAAEMGLGVLGALRAAHRAGVVHRDVKPGNVLIGEDGRVVLTDFGLATVPGDPNVTRTGLVLGSPAYIAPERARDGTAGPAADLWSLGATLYAAVEGASPFARPSAIATLTALATENPPPARNAGPLKPVLNGLLRKDPTHRINAEEAERLLLRASGRRSKLSFPMSPTMRRPGVGRERPALPGSMVSPAGSAPVVPGPRPPVAPARPPGPPPIVPGGRPAVGGGRPPVFVPGKAQVGRPSADTPTRVDGPKADAPRLDATRVDGPPVRDDKTTKLGTTPASPTAPGRGQVRPPAGEAARTNRGDRGSSPVTDRRGKKATPDTAADATTVVGPAPAARRGSAPPEQAAAQPAVSAEAPRDGSAKPPAAAGAKTGGAPAQPKNTPPGAAEPDDAQSGAAQSKAAESRTAQPGAAESSGAQSGAAQSKAAKSPTAQPGAESDGAQSGAAQSKAAESQTAQPGAAQSKAAQPVPAQSGATSSGAAQPGATQAEAAQPATARSEAQSVADEPGPASAEAARSGTAKSESESAKATAARTQPGGADAEAAQPDAAQSGPAKPAAAQLDTAQPGSTDSAAAQADSAQPGASGRETDQSDAGRPGSAEAQAAAARSEAAQSGAAKSNAVQPDAARTDAAKSDAAKSEGAKSDEAKSDEPKSDAAQSGTALAGAATSGATRSGAAADAAESQPAESPTAQPEHAQPDNDEHKTTVLKTTHPKTTQPKGTQPQATRSKAAQSKAAQRKATAKPATAPAADAAEEQTSGATTAPEAAATKADATENHAAKAAASDSGTAAPGDGDKTSILLSGFSAPVARRGAPDTTDDPAPVSPVPAISRPNRPAWSPLEVRPAGPGVTVFGTRLTYRQAAIGAGILLLVLVLVITLIAQAVGDDKNPPGTRPNAVPTAGASTAGTPSAPPSSASPSPATSSPSAFTLPAGWKLVKIPASSGVPALTVPVPEGARPSGSGDQLRFEWNNRLLLVGRTTSAAPDAYQDWVEIEPAFKRDKQNYKKIRIDRVRNWRGFKSVADWEFTYTTSRDNPQRVLKRNILVSSSAAYSLNWYASADDWAASQSDMNTIFEGFQPK